MLLSLAGEDGYVFIETIKHPVDENFFDVFRVVRELPDSKFEIPFDTNAIWDGDTKVLNEHNLELWCTCTEDRRCVHHKFADREATEQTQASE